MRAVASIALVFTLSVLVVASHARAADEMTESDKVLAAKAVEFASHWFSLVSAGDYAAACAEYVTHSNKDNSMEKWIEAEREFATEAGKLIEQHSSLGVWERNPKREPPGMYFLVYINAKFENINCYRSGIRVFQADDGNFHILNFEETYIDRKTEKAMRESQQKYNGARFPTDKITREEMENYHAEISTLAGWRGFQKDDTYVINKAENDTVYVFTMPDHPAHPAVVKLRQMALEGTRGLGVYGHFAGDEAAYRKWRDSIIPANSPDSSRAANPPIISVLSGVISASGSASGGGQPGERAFTRTFIVLADAIPSDSETFWKSMQVNTKLPPMEGVSDARIEQGLGELISSKIRPFALQNDMKFACLLPARGDDARTFTIPGSNTKISISPKNPEIAVVFYSGGQIERSPVAFSSGKPEPKRSTTTMRIGKVVLPAGYPVSLWVYQNLARIQDEAVKCGSPEVFLETSGSGKTTPVAIPGMKEPLQIFENDPAITATWYVNSVENLKKIMSQQVPGVRKFDEGVSGTGR